MQQRHNHKKGFKLLPSCSEAIGRNARRGFNLIEAAIVLAVVGLVVAGIWVAAASLKQRWFEQQFMEGLVVLKNNAQKYITQNESCLLGGIHYEHPNFYPLMQPKQWTELGIEPDGKIDISMRIECEGTSTFFQNEKYLSVVFWGLKQTDNLPFFCQNVLRKVEALCSRSGDCYIDLDSLNYNCQQAQTNLDIQVRIGRTR